jgi:glycosyltransferase involved in cell wall biosynthesis
MRTPRPDEDSGSASTFSYLQILARRYKVTFVPANLEKPEPYTSNIKRLGIRTLSAPKWKSLGRIIRKMGRKFDIMLFYRVNVAAQVLDLARASAPKTKIIFHAVDLHFLRAHRQAEVAGTLDRDSAEISRLRESELSLFRRSDASIVVSAAEHELIRQLIPEANVHHIPILRETIAANDPGFLQSIGYSIANLLGLRQDPPNRNPSKSAKRKDIVFIGGFEHLPNVDAVEWFVREVWPELLSRGFKDNFLIAGSKVPPQIAELKSERIHVLGYVKELAPLFNQCRLSVAPLRYGGGVKGKVVSSLNHGLPVVATSMATEGMNLRHGEHVMVADTAADFADAIMKAYNDDELWTALSRNGASKFEEMYSHAAGAPKIIALIESLRAKPMQFAR